MASILDGPSILSAPPATPKLTRRRFGDAASTRKSIYDDVLAAARNLQPVSNARHTLELVDVDYEDPEDHPISAQKTAILAGRTLSRRLRGKWRLRDNATGSVIDERRMTLAKVPYFTDRGTFIHNGTEYTLTNQLRLRPGIFTRVRENGEIEAHVNIRPGQGPSHRYFLDPEKGVFYVRLAQAKIPLLPLLKTMGVQDRQLQEAWGPALVAANYQKDDPAAFNKLYQRLVRRADPNADLTQKQEQLLKVFQKMELDPEVMKRTLNHPYERLDLDAILNTTKKLLAISRGEQEVDDRDHLAFQVAVGPEDLLSERLSKDSGSVRRQLLWKVSARNSLKSIPAAALNRQLEAALLQSGLGQSIEETNPGDIFDKQSRITRLGVGGIPSLDSVPDEARAVQPSHMGFLDPLRTPESLRVGVDIHLASNTEKGSDGRLYTPFLDARSGETVYRSPQDVADLAVAFPGEMQRPGKRVAAMQNGRIRFVPKAQVDLILPHFEHAFSPLGNLIPLKSAVKGQRAVMASRMLTQALPLTVPESPLVQSGVPGVPDRSYEEEYANHMGAVRAMSPGVVQTVNEDGITVANDDGTTRTYPIYTNFPYNRKTYFHNTPLVQPGQHIDADTLLAKSNYTDDKGTTALGLNARVGYLAFKGMNYEDAVVISQSMANRLSSEHMYQHGVDWAEEHRRGKRDFVGLFPSKYDRATLETLDNDGIVKPGTIVAYDSPIILAAGEREPGLHKVHRRNQPGFTDQTVTWEHSSPGIVTDVYNDRHRTAVLVKSISPMQVGDKLANRFGGKGVVASVVPDDQMPRDTEGQPLEILLNPLGVISRGNPAQMIETALGKIAARTGRPYKIQDFENIEDLTEFALQELRRNGMQDITEDVVDPETGRKIRGVAVGNQFFMKLHHTSESKSQARSTGGYTQTGEPARGGESGSKRLSIMDQNALLSHGAIGVMRDAASIRGQRNEEYWLPFLQGHTPPKPKIPFVYTKFINELKASGINVIGDGGQTHLMALTDRDIDVLAGNRQITNGETVRFEKALEPVKGGLFDPELTGGHHGGRWSYVGLVEPMPNPVMEDPIRRILGLTQNQFEEVLAGRRTIDTGTGPQAIQKALARINLPKEIAYARAQIRSGRKTARDIAVRRLGYLRSAQELGIHPSEWMLTKVPVLPPQFRPVSTMTTSKLPLVADANYLYKELLDANDNLKEMSDKVEDLGDERLAVYSAFKAVVGLGDPIHPKNQQRNVRGLLAHIFGSSPKYGTYQRRLISSSVDLVGRAAISPNPDLDMDHVGLPEDRAWDVYKNFIIRRLRRRGMRPLEILHNLNDRSPVARQELLAEMAQRPVIINRAPVLHKFSIQAFWPRLTKGDTLQISPLVTGGFGADFDGDAMQYHVPVDEEARQDAIERMLPSRNLLSPADFKTPVDKPTQEYLGGLYSATALPKKKQRPHYFASRREAIAAYLRGDIPIDAEVIVT